MNAKCDSNQYSEYSIKKIISFSLWGDDPKYTEGAIRNAQLAPSVYPEWICRFYIGKSVPSSIVSRLKEMNHVEIVEMDEQGDMSSMFWRFFPASEDDVDIMISRDTDSRLSLREKIAVDEWLLSDKGFHIMRDHPWHATHILGGMWGAKHGVLKNIKDMINQSTKQNRYGVDQDFLKTEIYPLIRDNCMVHDEFFNFDSCRRRFPSARVNYEFVGDVFDKDDKRDENFWKILSMRV